MGRSLKPLALCLLALCTACSGDRRIRVGSKNFSEQLVLGEIVAQHLENRLHGRVSRKLDLGGTLLAQQALLSGEIDVYPEYTGTALTSVLKQPPQKDPGRVLEIVRAGYRQWHLEWLDPLGFENTFAMTVRKEDAGTQSTLSAASRSRSWRLGAGYEFAHRPDGLPGLLQTYGLRMSGSPKTMDLGLLYQALAGKQVDMVAGNSTDGMLAVLPLTVLQDDKHYFPPYACALVVREEAERQFPGLRAALAELSGRIDSDTMRRLNYELDGKHRPAREIARNFLRTLSARYYKDGSEILIPQQDGKPPRRLTPTECARLMGFEPKKIVVSDTQAYRQFGNAVVPKVVEAVGRQIMKALAASPAD